MTRPVTIPRTTGSRHVSALFRSSDNDHGSLGRGQSQGSSRGYDVIFSRAGQGRRLGTRDLRPYAGSFRGTQSGAMGTRSIPGSGTAAPGDASAAIERWLADAIITAEQSTQMRVDLPEPAPSTSSTSRATSSVMLTSSWHTAVQRGSIQVCQPHE